MVYFLKKNLKILIMAVYSLLALDVSANDVGKTDRQAPFMAVYLLHFANFIEWPETVSSDKASFTICFYAKGNVETAIRELEGEQVKNSVIKLISAPKEDVLHQCQIIFIEQQNIKLFPVIKQNTQESAVLFVSDKAGFIEQGGTLEYFIENNKLRFAVNAELAKEKGLILSSKLLRIAKIVERKK
jgi:hypothetical protein